MYEFIFEIGEAKDAKKWQRTVMKKRTYLLNKRLKPIIDRKDLTELAKDLKPKREFVISIKMSPFQKFLYKKFMEKVIELQKSQIQTQKSGGGGRTTSLFTFYQVIIMFSLYCCIVNNMYF